MNAKNKVADCFRYFTPDKEIIINNPKNISNLQPVDNQNNEKKIPTKSKDWKKIEKYNQSVALNVIFVNNFNNNNKKI